MFLNGFKLPHHLVNCSWVYLSWAHGPRIILPQSVFFYLYTQAGKNCSFILFTSGTWAGRSVVGGAVGPVSPQLARKYT